VRHVFQKPKTGFAQRARRAQRKNRQGAGFSQKKRHAGLKSGVPRRSKNRFTQRARRARRKNRQETGFFRKRKDMPDVGSREGAVESEMYRSRFMCVSVHHTTWQLTLSRFPSPASSNRTCGFPAYGFPNVFVKRVK